jgi:hypothetical protein
MHANLKGANFSGADLQGARMEHTILIKADLRGANLCGVNFGQANMQSADLSPFEGKITQLDNAEFASTNLNGANCRSARFFKCNANGCKFNEVDFTGAILDESNINHTAFHRAILIDARLRRSGIVACDLTAADLAGADFYETGVNQTNFSGTKNARLAKNLQSVSGSPYKFDECDRHFIERWIDWGKIRTFGQLPLFGASYTALLFIFVYLGALEFYNDKVIAAHRWADRAIIASDKLPGHAADPVVNLAESVKDRLRHQRPPDHASLILSSTLLLMAASTIYVLRCPVEIKEFSSAQWCYELKHELIHYWPRSWKHRWWRVVCGSFYLVGATLAAWVIFWKIWWVISYLAHSQFE